MFGYTGEQTDPTGLVFLRARYYSPEVGRFLTPDSLVPDPLSSVGWNRYAYVGDNPIRYIDPSGHCLWDLCIAEAAAGATIGTYVIVGGAAAIGGTVYLSQHQAEIKASLNALEGLFTFPASAPDVGEQPGFSLDQCPNPANYPNPMLDVGGYLGGQLTFPGEIADGSLQILDPPNTTLDFPPVVATSGIYEFPDQLNPGKIYVGQSGNIERRLKQHQKRGRYKSGTATTTEVAGTKFDREIAEQNRINKLGGLRGGKISNQRNPVGPARREEAGRRGLRPFEY